MCFHAQGVCLSSSAVFILSLNGQIDCHKGPYEDRQRRNFSLYSLYSFILPCRLVLDNNGFDHEEGGM